MQQDAVQSGEELTTTATSGAPTSTGAGVQLKRAVGRSGLDYQGQVDALSPVIQAKAGPSGGGVGAPGDAYEQHADAVADAVVQGRSAEPLLDLGPRALGAGAGGSPAVQLKAGGGGGGGGVMSGTSAITQDQADQIAEIADTSSDETVGDLEHEALYADLGAAIDEWLTKSLDHYRQAYDPAEGVVRDMGQLQSLSETAQSGVQRLYGGWIQSAGHAESEGYHGPPDMGEGGNLKPQEELHGDKEGLAKHAVAVSLVKYAMVQDGGGLKVLQDHDVDLSRTGDAALLTAFAHVYAATNGDELTELQSLWPAETDGQIIFLQPGYVVPAETETLAAEGVPDAAIRRGYWDAFYYLIHEYIHTCCHEQYKHFISGTPQVNVLNEGVTEYFADKVWDQMKSAAASDDALRASIEKGAYDYNSGVVGMPTQYPEIAQARSIVSALGGEDNLMAAYFMGHTELLGLGDYFYDAMADEAGLYIVPETLTPTEIASRLGVDADTIVANNGLSGPDEALDELTLLEIPGVVRHISVYGETADDMAAQWNVDASTIIRANPHLDFDALSMESEVAIPL